jgi:hypothetical protein
MWLGMHEKLSPQHLSLFMHLAIPYTNVHDIKPHEKHGLEENNLWVVFGN